VFPPASAGVFDPPPHVESVAVNAAQKQAENRLDIASLGVVFGMVDTPLAQ
jgi:hypothetical protein